MSRDIIKSHVYKAKNYYICNNCKNVIDKGERYRYDVVKLDNRKVVGERYHLSPCKASLFDRIYNILIYLM